MVFMLYMKKMQEIATEKWDNVKYVFSKQTDLKKAYGDGTFGIQLSLIKERIHLISQA